MSDWQRDIPLRSGNVFTAFEEDGGVTFYFGPSDEVSLTRKGIRRLADFLERHLSKDD